MGSRKDKIMDTVDKKVIKEEWWAGCHRDDYFLHGGMDGIDYNNGYTFKADCYNLQISQLSPCYDIKN